jgi:hypothetical protein
MINAQELSSYARTMVETRRQEAEEYRLARLAARPERLGFQAARAPIGQRLLELIVRWGTIRMFRRASAR